MNRFRIISFIGLVIIFAFYLVCTGTENAPAKDGINSSSKTAGTGPSKSNEELNNQKSIITDSLKATFAATGFHIQARGNLDVTGPKTNIKAETVVTGIHRHPDISCLTFDSEDMGDKMEVYQQGGKTAVRNNKNNKWVKQEVVSPTEFVELLKETLENIKLTGEEKIDKINCRIIEATLNQDGINKILALYNIGIFPSAEKKSAVKIWSGKEDNLIYKITVMIESVSENKPVIPMDDEEENQILKRKKPLPKTTVNFKVEISIFDYNKDVDIKIPEEVKKVWEEVTKDNNKKPVK
jgi:hypothetical protein